MSAPWRCTHMRNKKFKNIPLDRECLMEALQLRNSSIRKLGKDYKFSWSSKSVERGIKGGEISPQLMDALGQYLNVDTDYLSGKYHREAEKTTDESLCSILKSQLKAEKFPYILNQQRIQYNKKFLYDRYLEYILIIHNIAMRQFDEMQFEKQKAFQLELEDAIAEVLIRHFPSDSLGQDIRSSINRIRVDIESYDPDELKIPENIPMDEGDLTDPLEEKYSGFQMAEGSEIKNQKRDNK